MNPPQQLRNAKHGYRPTSVPNREPHTADYNHAECDDQVLGTG